VGCPPPAGAPLDFTSSDSLGLSVRPALRKAAHEAIDGAGLRGVDAAEDLADRFAEFVGGAEAVMFPPGANAACGAVRGLVRPGDHVVIDAHADGALRDAAAAATGHVYLFRHNRVDECRRWLEKIRAGDAENGVLVVTQTFFATDCDSPDLAALQAACDAFGATMLADATHDLGCVGRDGRGAIGEQKMLGQIDLVCADLSLTFGADGGFVACRRSEVADYLRAFAPGCGPLPALQSAVAAAALDMVEGEDGERLRERLARNVAALCAKLHNAGFEVSAAPAPTVCVKIASETLARLTARRLPSAGLAAEVLEFPAAPMGRPRIRLRVSALHTEDNIVDAAAALKAAHDGACDEAAWLESERDKLRVANG
jgi:glycine C-acetyltransferase